VAAPNPKDKTAHTEFPYPKFIEDNEDDLTLELNGDASLYTKITRGPDGQLVFTDRPLKELLAAKKRG